MRDVADAIVFVTKALEEESERRLQFRLQFYQEEFHLVGTDEVVYRDKAEVAARGLFTEGKIKSQEVEPLSAKQVVEKFGPRISVIVGASPR